MTEYNQVSYRLLDCQDAKNCHRFSQCSEYHRVTNDEFDKQQDYRLISCILQVDKVNHLNEKDVWKEIAAKFNNGHGGHSWQVLKERYFTQIIQNLGLYSYVNSHDLDRLQMTQHQTPSLKVQTRQAVTEDEESPSQTTQKSKDQTKKKPQSYYLRFLQQLEEEQEDNEETDKNEENDENEENEINVGEKGHPSTSFSEQETDGAMDSFSEPDERDENQPSRGNKQKSRYFNVIKKSPPAKVKSERSAMQKGFAARLYSDAEDMEILKRVLSHAKRSQIKLKGRDFWIALEKATNGLNNERTWQSLKERFVKKILPNLSKPEFKLNKKDAESILRCTSTTESQAKNILRSFDRRK